MREVLAHDAVGVITQIVHAQLVVGGDQDEHRFFNGRSLRIGLDRELGAVGGSDVGAALDVVAGDVNFLRGHGVDQVIQALAGIRRVFAVREARDQFAEGVESFAGSLGVALGRVLGADVTGNAEIVIEVDQALQVIDVVDGRVARVQLDEAVAGGQRRARLIAFPVDVTEFKLGLLGIAAIGKARLQLFQVLGGLVPGFVGLGVLGFGIKLARRPAGGFIRSLVHRAATGDEGRKEKSHHQTEEGGKRLECG